MGAHADNPRACFAIPVPKNKFSFCNGLNENGGPQGAAVDDLFCPQAAVFAVCAQEDVADAGSNFSATPFMQ